MKFLNLNNNPHAGDRGCNFITEHVVRHGKLRTLFLSGNGLTDESVVKLAEQLRSNTTLRILELRKNEITDRGAFALADALSRNKTLASLFLSTNQIGSEGAVKLVTSLGESGQCKIWLDANPNISEQTQKTLTELAGNLVKFKG